MTQPPQYPGTPEPPEEPQGSPEPEGTTPPPIPPAPPASPSYGTPPPPPAPPYGAPQQPPAYGSPYGAPQPPQYGAPQQQPVYGAPQQPYGGYPTGPVNDQPSKGMAIAALVLSFLGCTFIAGIVAIVLAIVVLVRGKDGRNHGKGLAIAAIIVSVVVMALTAVVVAIGVIAVEEQAVDNLKVGECFNADDLDDDAADYVGVIDKVSCDKPHDAEVVSTGKLTAAEAAGDFATDYDCSPYVDPALMTEYVVFGVTENVDTEEGDAVACVAISPDGEELTGKIG